MCFNKQWCLAVLLMLCAEATTQQPPWTGIVESSRAIDWSHAGVLMRSSTQDLCSYESQYPDCVRGIPNNRTQCVPTGAGTGNIQANGTIMPSGNTDITDANNINAALQTCPANTYLLLGPGTFYIVNALTFGGPVNSSPAPGPFKTAVQNVTLRGSGPSATILKNMTQGTQDCGPIGNAICIWGNNESGSNYSYPYVGSCAWTAGYAKGATQLTLANCVTGIPPPTGATQPPALSNGMPDVGTIIILDQRNDDGVGLERCISSGSVATCTVSTSTLPPTFVPHACVGLGGVGPRQSGAGSSAYMSIAPVTTFWQANHSYTANSYVVDTNGHVQQVTTAGTSGASVPTWASTAAGNTTGDGMVTWTLTIWGPNGTSYNAQMNTPQTNPSVCNQITSISGNTFSYNLTSDSNLPQIGPCDAVSPWPNNNYVNAASNTPCGFATVDTGGMFIGGTNCVTTDGNCPTGSLSGGFGSGRMCPDPRNRNPVCEAGEITWRTQNQIVRVTNVQGNVITIDTPLYHSNWRAAQFPGIWWTSLWVEGIGIENLTVDASNDGGVTGQASINFSHCHNCWVRNVRSLAGSRNHIWFQFGNSHCTVRDSYFFDTKRGSFQSYGVELYAWTNDVLVENNIFNRVVSSLMNGGSTASVESYNYARDDGYGSSVGTMMMGISPNHDVSFYNLFESNNTAKESYDNTHGNSGPAVHFRTRARGQSIPLKYRALTPMQMTSFIRGISVIGSVLGTVGTPVSIFQVGSPYQTDGGGTNNCGNSIYCLGSTGQTGTLIPDDPLVRKTLTRWGNYDTITGAVRWCATGNELNCAGLSELAGAFPGLPAVPVPSQTLPPSFYLSAKPQWYATKWGTSPWPSIGPDVSGGDAPDGTNDSAGGGMAYRIPAQLVSENMPIDANYLISGNVVTGASWAPAGGGQTSLATLTGTFYLPFAGTFRLTGMAPGGYNGTYQVFYANGPTPDSSTSTSASAVGTGAMIYDPLGYRTTVTRLNSTAGVQGETTKSGTDRRGVDSTCPTTVGGAGSGRCGIVVTSPCPTTSTGGCPQNGYPMGNAQAGQWYNVYMNLTSDPNGKFCKQNASPMAIGSGAAFNYTQTTPICLPSGANCSNTGGACIEPPTVSTAVSTQIQYYQPVDPGGVGTVMGTITSPLVQVFDADEYYYGAAPVPQPPTVAYLTVNPSTISVGQSSTLSWSTSNADTVNITPIGSVATSGSQSVSPSATTTYSLTATNANGTNGATATLTVAAPPVTGLNTITGVGVIQGNGVVR